MATQHREVFEVLETVNSNNSRTEGLPCARFLIPENKNDLILTSQEHRAWETGDLWMVRGHMGFDKG